MEREIFVKNRMPSELFCKQIDHTSSGTSLDLSKDCLLMFHEDKGYFIATHKLGTWAEADAIDIFNLIKRIKGN